MFALLTKSAIVNATGGGVGVLTADAVAGAEVAPVLVELPHAATSTATDMEATTNALAWRRRCRPVVAVIVESYLLRPLWVRPP
jgi:hypothetical protein